ncbi:MAG: hypothetical protein HC822_25150 [Oscillochloris sp.]|nr:hypothetical protein [Oscillochloris sp.]
MAPSAPPAIYRITLQGHLESLAGDWFEGLQITLEDHGITVMTGPIIDQAALHRILRNIRDLGLPLLALEQVAAGQADM